MSMKEVLSNIRCTACGNCCPDYCKHKTPESLCDVHPTIVGEDQAAIKRGQSCHLPPFKIITYRYLCPPVVELIEKETGVKAIPNEEREAPGVVLIKNWDEVGPILDQLLGYEE